MPQPMSCPGSTGASGYEGRRHVRIARSEPAPDVIGGRAMTGGDGERCQPFFSEGGLPGTGSPESEGWQRLYCGGKAACPPSASAACQAQRGS